jgi:hypothetical protein
MRTRRIAALLAVSVLGVAFAAVGTPAQAQESRRAHQVEGRRYYVDCGSGHDAASGTSPTTAWRTLAKAETVTFRPGDSIQLRRGTTCQGTLQPKGSGTASAPITLGAYGDGARPAINGGGARAAVFLHNVDGWEIHDLDVSDAGTADGTSRTGIYVLLDDFGTGRHYLIDQVKVHDVPGCDCLQPDLDNSGGILFKAAGSTTPTGFDDIRVTRSEVSGADNIGIGTLSQWSRRDGLYPGGTNSFVPMTNVRIDHNRVSGAGGDGIIVSNGVDSVEEYNVVDGFGLRATASHAGILAFDSDRPVVQYNEVTGGASSPPSFAFSVDAANRDLLYQYNYSHDNHGPFILLCAFAGTYGDGATVRYNVSEDDQDLLIGTFDIPVVSNGCDDPIKNVKFYNNVISSTVAGRLVRSLDHTPIAFSNNVFVGRSSGATIVDAVGSYAHNVYRNVTAVPAGDNNAVTADPMFISPGSGPRGYRLKCGSPAIGAGVAISGDGGHDLFGNQIPTRPNIGVYQGGCVS